MSPTKLNQKIIIPNFTTQNIISDDIHKRLMDRYINKLNDEIWKSITNTWTGFTSNYTIKQKRKRVVFRIKGPPTLLFAGKTLTIQEYIKKTAKLTCIYSENGCYYFYCYSYDKLNRIKLLIMNTQKTKTYNGSSYTMEIAE